MSHTWFSPKLLSIRTVGHLAAFGAESFPKISVPLTYCLLCEYRLAEHISTHLLLICQVMRQEPMASRNDLSDFTALSACGLGTARNNGH